MYDYLIVGSGLFGITFARLATDAGKSCFIIDKRPHIGGNCYTEKIENINVHMYGPHIFHTNNKVIWDFINRFANFNSFIFSPKAIYKNKLYSLPFNMNTFYELWGVQTPQQAKDIIKDQQFFGIPSNLEEQALSMVGKDVYETLIKGYTEKQWGKSAIELPPFIIKRLPLRFTFDNNYFNDTYQGIPLGGYTLMMQKMIGDIPIRLNTDYFFNRDYFDSCAKQIVYTGCIDQFFNYEYGKLEYRSLKFKHQILDQENYQGVAVKNYCDHSTNYTRIIEHKHFEKINTNKTVITKEYPQKCENNLIPYYPINDEKNDQIYKKYQEKSRSLTSVIFGGRLSQYKYMNMDDTIKSAMNMFKQQFC